MEDLSPYLCTFEGCLQAGTRFTQRRLWFRHELEIHRSIWVCNHTDCREEFSKSELFERHMVTAHRGAFGKKQLPSIMSMCRSGRPLPLDCPLCSKSFATAETFRRHLAGEMEELALFVLPRTQDFDDDSASGNESEDSSVAASLSRQHSVANASKDVTVLDDGEEPFVHLENPERDKHLVVGADVFYRHPKGALNVDGEGIQCIITKVYLDKKPYVACSCSTLDITNTLIKDLIRCSRS
jgi:hypothetical protein